MRIGELAGRVGASTRALRHYESQGLLRARRDASGYRDYDEHDLRLAIEIRSLLAIGFTLEETRPFVDCLRAGHAAGDACPDSVAVYQRKLAEVDACLARLNNVRDRIAEALIRSAEHRAAAPSPRCELTTN